MSKFSSGFAQKLEDMLEYRVARGYKKESYIGNIVRFDKYCLEHFPKTSNLTQEIVHAWFDSETDSACSLSNKATVIRQFGKYLSAINEEAYILPEKFTPRRKAFNPYIFTDNELTALFLAIDTLSPTKNEPFLNEIAPVLLRLTYTCGLRPNESREILCENINLNTGEILVTNTKHRKERLIVMSDDMLALCQKYELRRRVFSKNSPYFFPAGDGNALGNAKILAAFNKAWKSATRSPQNPTPCNVRVYDLRHRFASACLNQWLDSGENLMVMLPYLRAYMGHNQLTETAYYIHILPENLVKSPAIDWDVFNAMFPEVEV